MREGAEALWQADMATHEAKPTGAWLDAEAVQLDGPDRGSSRRFVQGWKTHVCWIKVKQQRMRTLDAGRDPSWAGTPQGRLPSANAQFIGGGCLVLSLVEKPPTIPHGSVRTSRAYVL